MRIGMVPKALGVALVAMVAVSSAGAASSVNSEVNALKRVGLSWVTYAANGNAPRACRLQTEPSVEGIPCDQLPTDFVVLHCPEDRPSESRWRKPSELVGKVNVQDGSGTIIYRAASKQSNLRAKARFSKVGGKWRIASIQSEGQRLRPAGLIFTDGRKLRKKLWPPHC